MFMRIVKVCWKEGVSNENLRENVRRQRTVVNKIMQRKLKQFGLMIRIKDGDAGNGGR